MLVGRFVVRILTVNKSGEKKALACCSFEIEEVLNWQRHRRKQQRQKKNGHAPVIKVLNYWYGSCMIQNLQTKKNHMAVGRAGGVLVVLIKRAHFINKDAGNVSGTWCINTTHNNVYYNKIDLIHFRMYKSLYSLLLLLFCFLGF